MGVAIRHTLELSKEPRISGLQVHLNGVGVLGHQGRGPRISDEHLRPSSLLVRLEPALDAIGAGGDPASVLLAEGARGPADRPRGDSSFAGESRQRSLASAGLRENLEGLNSGFPRPRGQELPWDAMRRGLADVGERLLA